MTFSELKSSSRGILKHRLNLCRMENAGNIGSRRREGKKYAVEDEALDRIAKEASNSTVYVV